MAEELYQITYRVDSDAAKRDIQTLANGLIAFGAIADNTRDRLSEALKPSAALAKNVGVLSGALDDLQKRRGAVADFQSTFGLFAAGAAQAREGLAGLSAELSGLNRNRRVLGSIGSEAGFLAQGSGNAASNVAALAAELGKLGGRKDDLAGVRVEVVGVQRSAYGASKNVEELNHQIGRLNVAVPSVGKVGAALGHLGKSAGGATREVAGLQGSLTVLDSTEVTFDGLNKSVRGLRRSLAGAKSGARKFGPTIGAWAARIATIQGVAQAVRALGEAIHDANRASDQGGRKNLHLRDSYRELANLQGKAEPDDTIVGAAMRFRVATGLDDREANEALRRFEGGIPFARDKGNIVGKSTEGVAGEFLTEATRTGVRAGVGGGTSAQLAAKLAQTQKIPSADVGLAAFSAIIDTLNRGDGDIKPLVSSLIAGSGGMVGQGAAFASLGDFAAAESIASTNATPRVASTRVRQAFTGMGKLDAGTQKRLGIALHPGDFVGNIEALAPVLDGAKDRDAALKDAGIANQAERRAIIQFYENRKLLRQETDRVRKASGADRGKTVAEARGLNDRFYAGDTAQKRVAEAQVDASKFEQFSRDEPTAILRDKAEAELRRKREIDTPDSNTTDAMLDFPVTRFLGYGVNLGAGMGTPRDALPLFMGGKSAKQLRIDAEARKNAEKQARSVGIDPEKFRLDHYGSTATTPEEYLPDLARETRARGGSPYGGTGQTDALMRQLIREQQRTNQLIEGAQKKGDKVGFLPAAGYDDSLDPITGRRFRPGGGLYA